MFYYFWGKVRRNYCTLLFIMKIDINDGHLLNQDDMTVWSGMAKVDTATGVLEFAGKPVGFVDEPNRLILFQRKTCGQGGNLIGLETFLGLANLRGGLTIRFTEGESEFSLERMGSNHV